MACGLTKIESIRQHFTELIGQRISRYQTAQLLLSDGSWDNWPDLPIRIYTDRGHLVSVSWSQFDDLWLSSDSSLPFVGEDATTRWVDNSIAQINECFGRTIRGVMLGRGEMSVEGRDIEVWTRLVVHLGDCWLEIFNALDENGYNLHRVQPSGEFVHCI
jgi:hypothetical protein